MCVVDVDTDVVYAGVGVLSLALTTLLVRLTSVVFVAIHGLVCLWHAFSESLNPLDR